MDPRTFAKKEGYFCAGDIYNVQFFPPISIRERWPSLQKTFFWCAAYLNFLLINSRLVKVSMRGAAEGASSQSTFKSKMAALSDVLIISYRTVLTACPQVLVLSTGASQFTIFQGRGMKKKPDLYHMNERGKFLKKLRCCFGGELTLRALALRRSKSIHSDEGLTH